jgi:hypothetical protein
VKPTSADEGTYVRSRPHRSLPNGSLSTFSHGGLIRTRPHEARIDPLKLRHNAANEDPHVLATSQPHHLLLVTEMVPVYLACSLCLCALTCYSCYIAVAPRLHHTLIASTDFLHKDGMSMPKRLMYKPRSCGFVGTAPTSLNLPLSCPIAIPYANFSH